MMKPPKTVIQNISTAAKLERDFIENRTWSERIGDAIGGFAGSMSFVVLHVIWFVGWVFINTRLIPGIPAFDPYPFIFLSMVVSLEGVLLATFVLMKQNRMSRRADQRAQLDLQVNLLAERETTKNLQLLQRLCKHLGLDDTQSDHEIHELSQNTAIETLVEHMRRELPEE
jgi:uncharacterized membrane protein